MQAREKRALDLARTNVAIRPTRRAEKQAHAIVVHDDQVAARTAGSSAEMS